MKRYKFDLIFSRRIAYNKQDNKKLSRRQHAGSSVPQYITIKECKKMKIVNKKSVSILSFVLALTLIISGTLTSMQPAWMATSPFSDVPSTHWGLDGIIVSYV